MLIDSIMVNAPQFPFVVISVATLIKELTHNQDLVKSYGFCPLATVKHSGMGMKRMKFNSRNFVGTIGKWKVGVRMMQS